MSDKKIAICVLSYNTEKYISKVLKKLSELNLPILVIDDGSLDQSTKIIEDEINTNKSISLLKNEKNEGAGSACRKIIHEAKKQGYEYVVKVDGDDQFQISDIKIVVNNIEKNEFEFVKSNRFWELGILGTMPKIRYFGNLLATQFLHFAIGSNKLYDPLNGLFGVKTEIYKSLENKRYPKRYGYPFFITCQAILNGYKSLQINNKIKYEDQKSNIKPYRLLISLIFQTLFFNRKKFQLKKKNFQLHKSLFYEIFFRILLFLDCLVLLRFILGYFTKIPIFQTNIAGWGIMLVIFLAISVFVYSISFKLENIYRNKYIFLENE